MLNHLALEAAAPDWQILQPITSQYADDTRTCQSLTATRRCERRRCREILTPDTSASRPGADRPDVPAGPRCHRRCRGSRRSRSPSAPFNAQACLLSEPSEEAVDPPFADPRRDDVPTALDRPLAVDVLVLMQVPKQRVQPRPKRPLGLQAHRIAARRLHPARRADPQLPPRRDHYPCHRRQLGHLALSDPPFVSFGEHLPTSRTRTRPPDYHRVRFALHPADTDIPTLRTVGGPSPLDRRVVFGQRFLLPSNQLQQFIRGSVPPVGQRPACPRMHRPPPPDPIPAYPHGPTT